MKQPSYVQGLVRSYRDARTFVAHWCCNSAMFLGAHVASCRSAFAPCLGDSQCRFGCCLMTSRNFSPLSSEQLRASFCTHVLQPTLTRTLGFESCVHAWIGTGQQICIVKCQLHLENVTKPGRCTGALFTVSRCGLSRAINSGPPPRK